MRTPRVFVLLRRCVLVMMSSALTLSAAALAAQETAEAEDPSEEERPADQDGDDDEFEIIVRGNLIRGRTIGGTNQNRCCWRRILQRTVRARLASWLT